MVVIYTCYCSQYNKGNMLYNYSTLLPMHRYYHPKMSRDGLYMCASKAQSNPINGVFQATLSRHWPDNKNLYNGSISKWNNYYARGAAICCFFILSSCFTMLKQIPQMLDIPAVNLIGSKSNWIGKTSNFIWVHESKHILNSVLTILR